MAKIALIPGDGAGIEVAESAQRVLSKLGGHEVVHFDFGAERYLATGVAMPPGQIEGFRNDFDAILFGAIGDPRVPDNAHAREILLGMRFELDLYINFRPVRLLDERLSPLKGKGTQGDRLRRVPREHRGLLQRRRRQLQEGHARRDRDRGGGQHPQGRRADHPRRVRVGRRRTARSGSHGRQGQRDAARHDLWQRVFNEVAAEYPGIAADALLRRRAGDGDGAEPEHFDVIVTTNLFGDILTDLGAALPGGLGLAPSANLNPESTPLFEPVHGSAPDIAGQGHRQPDGDAAHRRADAAGARREEDAARIERAVEGAVHAGETTRDVGGSLGTREVTDDVLARLFGGGGGGGKKKKG